MSNRFKSSGKMITIDQAVGTVLGHDITEIRAGQFKGAAFKKGHITREDIASMAHGGLCLNCDQCRYPVCPFGK